MGRLAIRILMVIFLVFLILIGESHVIKAQLGEELKKELRIQGIDPQGTRSVLVAEIGRVIGIALSLIGTVALGYVIYGGYLWIRAGGNAEQAGYARRLIVNSVIAIIIIGSSYAIMAYLIDILQKSFTK